MKVFPGKAKKLKSTSKFNTKSIILWGTIFALIGVGTLLVTRAATPTPITIDATLPVPKNVKAFPDDRNIIVTWDNEQFPDVNTKVIGYYITYRPKGSTEEFKVKQQQVTRNWDYFVDYRTAIQLQPLQNGTEYEIYVQSVAGSMVSYAAGPNSYDSNWTSAYAVGNGKVSNKSTVIYSTPSSARVDAMRTKLTGFFDDFNQPAGPFDELKWNTATTSCVSSGTAAAFINDQFHAHNQIRSSCDRSGIASRPRAVFDTSTATEANPAEIRFDVDGASQSRDTWYLDMIPLSNRPVTNAPIDITSHNDLFDGDSEDPGNMVRINARYDSMNFHYYTSSKSSTDLQEVNDTSASTIAKTLSPLPQPTVLEVLPLPNVRHQWVIQITPTVMRVFIDGNHQGTFSLPAAFSSQKKYTLHSTMFSYNTGKQYVQVTPYVQLLHWDNFGFTGPAPTEEIHNYVEGGPTGTTPVFSTTGSGGFSIPEYGRTTTIPIPDPIGNLKNGKARLYFTMVDLSAQTLDAYDWSSSQNIVINGKSYPFPDPRLNMISPTAYPKGGFGGIVQGYVPLAMTLDVNQADLVQGKNTIKFSLGAASLMNVHMELPYDVGNAPAYTQPKTIFGHAYEEITKPPITTCDQYWFVERDLGLPYETGKANLTLGPCAFIGGHTGSTSPPPTDTVLPSAVISSPTSASTISGTINVSGSATDNVGVTKVELYVDGVMKLSANGSSASYTLNTATLTNGAHTFAAWGYDAAGNVGKSTDVTATVNNTAPADTTAPTNVVVNPPANGATVSGNTTVLSSASDNVGISKVEFYMNNTGATGTLLIYTDTIAPFTFGLDTTKYANGSYTLISKAYDTSNNSTTSSAVTFTINNVVPDTTAPTITLAPAYNSGTTVAGTINLTATATDNIGVTKVDFLVDGAVKNSDTSSPYAYSLDTKTLTNAVHSFSASAYDAAGNKTNSPTYSVTVNNATPPPVKTGDFTGDNKVDFHDLLSLLSQYGGANPTYDLSSDGKVDFHDLLVLLSKYGS